MMAAATNTVESTNTTTDPAVEVKSKAKGKVKKLVLVNKGFRPGIQIAGTGPAATDVYSIVFGVPLATSIGTADEIGQIHLFATGLDALAQTEAVGVVSNIGIVEGKAEVTLKLVVPDDFPTDPTDEQKDGLVATAFQKLNDYLVDTAVLKVGNTRNRPTWAYKVNGSVLDDGQF
jgi:hypothetical protein